MSKSSIVKSHAVLARMALIALLVITAMATTSLRATPAAAAQASIAWSAPTDSTGVTGYKVHVGNSSGSYSEHVDVGNTTSYSAGSLSDGSTYYFAVTAYNAAGQQSAYSNEISRTFAALPTTYTITASAGAGGTITALNNTKVSTATSGTSAITSVTVASGASQSFSIAAASGYKITDVKVDGVSKGAVSSYSFSNVTANHSISATFGVNSYTITASAGSGGSIIPPGTTTVAANGSQSYTITPATGYKIAGVTVDGTSVGAVGSYTFNLVSSNHTISASFALQSGVTVFATNAGGSAYTGGDRIAYKADSYYSGGTAKTITATISGTTDDMLYQTYRYGSTTAGSVFSYNVPLANGNYSVTLKFADNMGVGKRVFDVKMEGTTVLSNFDIYAKAGNNTAYDLTIPVSVADGVLNIGFVSKIGSPKINAIVVKTR